jgi:hypothetical protein
MRVAFLNHPHSDADWNIRDCVAAAAQLVDETMEVVEFAPASSPPDALIFGGSPEEIKVFPAIPLARMAIAAGPPGPAVRATLSIYNGPHPQDFRFRPDEFGLAVIEIARWMESSLQLGVSAEERRRIETIQHDVASAIHDGVFESIPDLAAQLRSVADTLDAQMKAPHAGRGVIGWCLRQLNTFPAGVLGNVAASYLIELLPHFPR